VQTSVDVHSAHAAGQAVQPFVDESTKYFVVQLTQIGPLIVWLQSKQYGKTISQRTHASIKLTKNILGGYIK
jgi:hypothetical protein